MRAFKTIETELSKQKRFKKLSTEKKNSSGYLGGESIDKVIIVAPYVCGVIASIITFLVTGIVMSDKGFGYLNYLWAAPFIILSILLAINYLRLETPRFHILRIIAILNGIPLLFFAVNSVSNLFGTPLIFVVFEAYKESILDDFSYDIAAKIILFSDIVLFLPVLIIFIGTIIQLIIRKKKIEGLEKTILLCDSLIKALKEELEKTKTEAKQRFSEESVKDQPNVSNIQELAALGYEPAQKWLIEYDHRRGKQIFDEEIKKENPNITRIKNAADLGYPEACEYYGEFLAFSNEKHTVEEVEKILKQAQDYFKVAAEAGNSDAKMYYLHTRNKTESLSESDWKKLLEEVRNVEKSGKLCERAQKICKNTIEEIIDIIDSFEYDRRHRSSVSNSTSIPINIPSPERKPEPEIEFYPVIDVTGM